VFKNLDGIIPAAGEELEDVALLAAVDQGCMALATEFDRFAFSNGIEAWMGAVFACNAYVDSMAPWGLKKTDPERMAQVLGTVVAAVSRLATAIAPVVPGSSAKLLRVIAGGAEGAAIDQPTPAFPRLELAETGA
jgi:methionyl-tRNA synthetase